MSRLKLFVDVVSGEIRPGVGAAPIARMIFFNCDIIPMEIQFLRFGENITAEVLANNATLRVGLRGTPGSGDLLGLTAEYELVDEVARLTFNLATEEATAFIEAMPTSWREGAAFFEIKVVAADESSFWTISQIASALRREVVANDDLEPVDTMLYVLKTALFDSAGRAIAPQFLGVRSDVTTAALHRAVITAGRVVPWVMITLEDDLWCTWTLRTRIDGEVDDTVGYRVPTDYNLATNNTIWVKSGLS